MNGEHQLKSRGAAIRTTPMPPALEVRNVRKAYRRRVVLRDVCLTVPRGRMIGVVGENGAGKSTLLNIVAGLLRPCAGTVHVDGRLGYCPQQRTVFERLTMRENFRYFAAAYGRRRVGIEWQDRMHELADRLGFAPWLDTPVTEISGGTAQKLNLSLALLHRPTVLVLDEPYTGFDWQTYLLFRELAQELRDEGCAIVIVTHFVHERHWLDEVYELREGVLQCN